MRHEHDAEKDVFRNIFSEDPVVRSEEFEQDGARFVTHFGENGLPVSVEIHGASKLQEGAQPSKKSSFQAEKGSDEVLFTLDWTFVDFDDPENPVSGKTPVCLSDFSIHVVESKDVTVVRKSFRLDGRLVFSLADSGCDTPNASGMAFKVDYIEGGTFSWEWFQPKGADRLVKIQERGELLASYRRAGSRWEVADTTLVTDLSLRFQNFKDGPTMERFHRLSLKAGAVLRWPALVDGKVVMPS